MFAPRASSSSLIEFPGSRNRVTYGSYGQFSCVREREHPCVLHILALCCAAKALHNALVRTRMVSATSDSCCTHHQSKTGTWEPSKWEPS